MGAEDYKPGGSHWANVETIMNACSCSRLRAVSSLKLWKNDVAAAIESLKEVAHATAITSRPKVQPEAVSGNDPKSSTKFNAGTISTSPMSSGLIPVTEDEIEYSRLNDAASFKSSSSPSVNSGLVDLKPKVSDVPPMTGVPTASGTQLRPNVGVRLSKPGSTKSTIPSAEKSASDEPGPGMQWDFRLPRIELSADAPTFSPDEGKSGKFSIHRVISSLQHQGLNGGQLQHYFSFFDLGILRQNINASVSGYPAIFYAVATNDEGIARAFGGCGANVNVVEPTNQIPLLAFAVLMASTLPIDTTAVVLTLLSLGADSSVIPSVFYSPYLDDPIDKMPFGERFLDSQTSEKRWCKGWLRDRLAVSINLTQRYFIYKKMNEAGPSDRQQQVAEVHKATAMLGMPYFLIGQTDASNTVIQKLLSHMALPKSKPLVMMFAGPSGHGKTELSKRMGDLLSLEMERIDCTEMKHETDLFGPKKPYIGHENGSPLNNFLANLSGRRCIVFLDEFEKTTQEVQNALLIPFDEGRYVDRRNRKPVDCSQTIWVIATNALDHIILDHCDLHHKAIFTEGNTIRQKELRDELSSKLQKQAKMEFGNPLSGRLSIIVPFMPFSPGEAAVIAHKYILDLKRKVIKAVQVSGKQLVGQVVLNVRRDGAICGLLASDGYDSDQGARSLKLAVESRIEDELVLRYLEEDGRIQDRQDELTYTVDVARNGVLSVFRSG